MPIIIRPDWIRRWRQKARVEVLQREDGRRSICSIPQVSELDEAENTPEGEAVPGQMACRAGKSSFCGELAGRDAFLCGTG